MAIKLKITGGPGLCFRVSSIKLSAGAGTGTTGTDGTPGTDGTNGTNGTNGTDGEGVPIGGTTGQQLAKATNDDFDTEWVDPGGGGGGWTEIAVRDIIAPVANVIFDATEVTDTHKEHRLRFDEVEFDGSSTLHLKLGFGATPTYLGNVNTTGVLSGNSGSNVATFARSHDQAAVVLGVNVASTYKKSGIVLLEGLRVAEVKRLHMFIREISESNVYFERVGSAHCFATDIINTIQILPSGSTRDIISGKITLEGK